MGCRSKQKAFAAGCAGKQPAGKGAITIFLPGGPPHMDMYDPKPDAPAGIRGEFDTITTKVAGVQIREHMPMQARMWDKFAVVRSVASNLRPDLPPFVSLRGMSCGTESAIDIFLQGGMRHQDRWELKPDAPVEFRGEFKPIPTNVPGIEICLHGVSSHMDTYDLKRDATVDFRGGLNKLDYAADVPFYQGTWELKLDYLSDEFNHQRRRAVVGWT